MCLTHSTANGFNRIAKEKDTYPQHCLLYTHFFTAKGNHIKKKHRAVFVLQTEDFTYCLSLTMGISTIKEEPKLVYTYKNSCLSSSDSLPFHLLRRRDFASFTPCNEGIRVILIDLLTALSLL